MPIVLPGNRQMTLYAQGGGGYSTVQPISGVSFGNAALSVTGSALEHGQTLTISTDGTYSFGALPSDFEYLWVNGDTVSETGVDNTYLSGLADDAFVQGTNDGAATSPWYSAVRAYLSRRAGDLRHARVGAVLAEEAITQGIGETGLVTWPKVFSTNRVPNEAYRVCFATWAQKHSAKLSPHRACAYSNYTGTISASSDGFTPDGETCTLSGGATVKVLRIDTANSHVYLWVVSGTVGSAELNGTTLAGASGSMTMASGTLYQSGGAQKTCRVLQRADFASGSFAAIATDSLRLWDNKIYTGAYDDAAVTYSPELEDQWHKKIVEVDIRDPGTGFGRSKLTISDGSTLWEREQTDIPIAELLGISTNGIVLANWGLENSQINGSRSLFGELYVATGYHRVVIGDAATWAACTPYYTEVQKPVSWTDTEIQIVTNQGGLSDLASQYLYVIDGDNQPINTNGIALS